MRSLAIGSSSKQTHQAFLDAAELCAGRALTDARIEPQPGGSNAATAVVRSAQWQGFIKLARTDQLAVEQSGIEAIAATQSIRIPAILGTGSDGPTGWLAMEALELSALTESSAADLGEQLAALHSHTAPAYGWHCDGFLGDNEQPNDECDDWVEFFRDQRLGFQLQQAAALGYEHLMESGAELLENLPLLFQSYTPQASLIHGDLWPGNAAQLADGSPVIFDPAAYYGDAEAELGMCELFGNFPPTFWAAYRSVRELDAGYSVRRYLYRLYHLLNHLVLFGSEYEAKVSALINRLNNEIR